MLKKILNTGIYPDNSDSLNRKIRISNLIAFLSVAVVTSYIPLFIYYSNTPDIIMNITFWVISLHNFYLIKKRKYILAFFIHSIAGYLYFITGTLLYGTTSNLHFYMLVMCMIVSTLFDNKKVIKAYLFAAVSSFFALTWWSYYYEPLTPLPADLKFLETLVGNINLFLLFFIISVFILFFKNDMLRSQQNVLEQKEIIEEKNRDITDSINYAKRIQSALLPGKSSLTKLFPGSFLYFKPKDIVSGDFYWVHENEKFRFIAVGDCTGHGVPGALMSVLGINLLTEIVETKHITHPDMILNELRSGIIHAFDKEGKSSEYKDGMDISVVRIDKNSNHFVYAAANNPVYLITDHELIELPADKQPAGYSHEMKPFSLHEQTFTPGDSLILFTDGFADQFGGPKNKKFMYKSFKETLVKGIKSDPEKYLDHTFESWRGQYEQIDDICIAGIKL